MNLLSVIATIGRPELVKRTINSINQCHTFPSYHGIAIIENGPKKGIEELVRSNPWKIKVQYFYHPVANKSLALNILLEKFQDYFFYFHDDDITLLPDSLTAVWSAITTIKQPFFFGGPVRIDYEQPPPSWLNNYLPYSAKGWDIKTKTVKKLSHFPRPCFMGLNWGAASRDLRRVGGFSESSGPNQKAVGSEWGPQDRLYRAGIAPYYIPRAEAWHFVPRNRCSEHWALRRGKRTALFVGMINKNSITKHTFHFLMSWIKIAVCSLLRLQSLKKLKRLNFIVRFELIWSRSLLEGLSR